MFLSPRRNGLDCWFKEVRVFKTCLKQLKERDPHPKNELGMNYVNKFRRRALKTKGDSPLCDSYFRCFWHVTFPCFVILGLKKGGKYHFLLRTSFDDKEIIRNIGWNALFCKGFWAYLWVAQRHTPQKGEGNLLPLCHFCRKKTIFGNTMDHRMGRGHS